MRYLDKKKNQLVYVSEKSDPHYWDKVWENASSQVSYKKIVPKRNKVINLTKKYLPKGSLMLEGGAGLAQNSWYLYLSGYQVISLDYASKTIDFLKKKCPEVQPVVGDVRQLPFEDNSIDGYWSLGVIEHFYDGYQDIVDEMSRVLKPGGVLFLTFPHMSPIRRLKAKLKQYPELIESPDICNSFYQFALDSRIVKSQIEEKGFKCVYKGANDGLKGLKDEVELFRHPLQKIYDSSNFLSKALKRAIDFFSTFLFGHSRVFVFRKL